MASKFHILTLNPPFLPRFSRSQRSPAVIKSGVLYYPIWLAYATGVLEQDGFLVKLVDAPAASYDLQSVLGMVHEMQPNLIIVESSTPSINNDIRVAQAIKEQYPNTYILFVGTHVTALPEKILRSNLAVDAIARGEYDYIVRDVARELNGLGDLSNIDGLSFRDGNGNIIHNSNRQPIEDLDSLPFVSEVYLRHLRIDDYFYSISRYPQVTIVTGRGCLYKCTFCLWPQTLTGPQYRTRSISNVVAEFEFIKSEFPQVKEIFIEDDTLTVDKERCVKFAKALINNGNKQLFTANSRASVDFETLFWLKKAGLRLLCVGFESGDQEILNSMKKGIKVERFYQFRNDARRAGVMVHGCFMAGNSGETRESLAKTLELAKRLNPDTAQFFPLMVYPGTEAYEHARRNGNLTSENFQEWLTPDGFHNTVIHQNGLRAEDLVAWCNKARREFYLRPQYILAKVWQMMTHPGEVRRTIKSARIFLRHLFI